MTSTATKTTTFRSFSKNQSCTIVPERRPYTMTSGEHVPGVPRQAVEFEDHVAEIEEGPHGEAIVNGKPIVDGVNPLTERPLALPYETVVAHIRRLWLFNTPKGIWEDGAAPDEPKPTIAEQNTRIVNLMAQGDIEGLTAFIEEERALHNRKTVIDQAQAGIEALGGLE